jgi:ATP-dependent protease ClpP protease subunit
MPDELWTKLEQHDLYLTGKEALEFGLATEVGEFSAPPGTQIFKV